MKITPTTIKVKDIFDGYTNDEINGCYAYGGKLNIRPAYQREFVYDDKKQKAVIDTIYKGFPLNSMYWAKNEDGTYEMIDGQQRTISFCEFCDGAYSTILENSLNYFDNFNDVIKNKILDYECTIYICEGNSQEKLEWFKVINIASVQLTEQELRNAVYTGTWLTDAKKYFSKPNCAAYREAKSYLSGNLIRQDYLQTAIDWIVDKENLASIEDYMAIHQNDANANDLWLYFKKVIDWVKVLFPNYRDKMKGQDWGLIYNKYSSNSYDANALEEQVSALMRDDEVQNKGGIYKYVFDNQEKNLNLRAFSESEKITMYERQSGICPMCHAEGNPHEHYEINEMEADHVVPWHSGGKTNLDNGQMLCKHHNRVKSGS